MPLRRIAFAVSLTLPLAIACATGVEDPQVGGEETAGPVVPVHEISGDPPQENGDPIDVRSSIDERPNQRAVAGWDFEAASADCNGWSASGASAIRAIPSHTGAYACKLCADGSAPEMKLTRRVAGLQRGSWVVSAWLRRLATSPVALAARVTLDEATERAGIPINLDQEWRLLADPLDVETEVVSTSLVVIATASAGECILVDDVVVETATARAAHSPPPATPNVFISR
jgi:hypothetical protein